MSADSASTPPEPPPTIAGAIVVPMPPLPMLGGFSLRTLWQALFGVALAVALLVISFAMTRRTPPPALLGLMALIALSGVALVLIIKQRSIRRRLREGLDGAGPMVARIIGCCVAGDMFRPRAEVEARWKQLLRPGELAEPRPRSIVDLDIARRITLLPLRSELLEPEIINESDFTSRVSAAIFLFFGMQRLLPPLNANWPWGIFFLGMALIMFVRIPAIRDRIPFLRDIGSDVIAGPGWVRDRRGRQWRFDDSVAIVSAMRQRRRRRRGVRVRLIGPMGVRDVRFERADNADLAVFWERWMHPAPRTEFVNAE